MRRRTLGLFLLVCAACGPGPRSDPPGIGGRPTPAGCKADDLVLPDGTCTRYGWNVCPFGFQDEPSGLGCTEVFPTCAPGTMPTLGGACDPIGVASCPSGFVRDATGFGCAPTLPVAGCTDETRETANGCGPIGDCNAPFPPPGATLFVDDDFGPGQIDATHFASIASALAAAPAGATIAVETGTYAAPLTFDKSVTVLGRCAAKVVVDGAGAVAAGIAVSNGKNVTVRNIRLAGFEPGVDVSGGAHLTLEDAVVTGNRRNGLQVLGKGSLITLTRAVVRQSAQDASARFGIGISAGDGGRLDVADSAITDNREIGAFATGAGSTITLARTLVARTSPRTAGLTAVGASVQAGGRLETEDTLVTGSSGAGINVAGGSAALRSTIVDAVTPGKASTGSTLGAGVLASLAADVTLTDVTVRGAAVASVQTDGATLSVERSTMSGAKGFDIVGGTATLTRSAIVGATGIGIGARGGSTLGLDHILLSATRDVADVAYGVAVLEKSSVTGRDLVVRDTIGTGVVVFGDGSKLSLERAVVADTRVTAKESLGVGFLAEKGGDLSLEGSLVLRATSLGIASRGGHASLKDVLVRETVGVGDGLSGFGLVVTGGGTVDVNGGGFIDNALSAMIAGGADAAIVASRVTVAGTRFDAAELAGRGVSVQDDARIELSRAYLTDNGQAAMGVFGATASLVDSRLARSRKTKADAYGHGLLVIGGVVDLDGAVIEHHPSVGLLFSDATARVKRSRVVANAIGIQVQGESALRTVDALPDAPAAAEVLVTSDTRFEGNEVQVGSGALPLPRPLPLPE